MQESTQLYKLARDQWAGASLATLTCFMLLSFVDVTGRPLEVLHGQAARAGCTGMLHWQALVTGDAQSPVTAQQVRRSQRLPRQRRATRQTLVFKPPARGLRHPLVGISDRARCQAAMGGFSDSRFFKDRCQKAYEQVMGLGAATEPGYPRPNGLCPRSSTRKAMGGWTTKTFASASSRWGAGRRAGLPPATTVLGV